MNLIFDINRLLQLTGSQEKQMSLIASKSSIFKAMKPQTNNVLQVSPLSPNLAKWLNTFNDFIGNLPTNCLSVFDHFWGWRLMDLFLFFIKIVKSF